MMGRLLLREDAAYEAARLSTIWHSRHPDRYPDAILQAECEQDIVEGVRLAKTRGWAVAVRSGGHSFPVWSLRHGGLMIDLAKHREMGFDSSTGIATASPSIHGGGELGDMLAQYGRFFPSGNCPSVAIGGFLLQGGIGWNFRGWGYAAEQIVAIDVVLADGTLIRADAEQNSDVFWAARGAGPGFFGIITRFHLKTRPLPKALTAQFQAYPLSAFSKVLPWLFEAQKSISPLVHLVAGSMVPPFPVEGETGKPVFYVWGAAFCDTAEEAEAALAPLSECPFISEAYLVDGGPTTLKDQLDLGANIHPQGLRYRVDSSWIVGDYAEVVEASRMLLVDRPVDELGHTFFIFSLPRPEDAPEIAMDLRSECMMGAYVIYNDAKDDDKYAAWLRDAMKPLEPYSIGQYWGDSDQVFREVKCLTDEAFERMSNLRRKYDPQGVFAGYLAGPAGYLNNNGWENA